ncbi:MAG: glycosyl transferase, partial [Nitrospirae bacterium]
AAALGREMGWSRVAERYLEVCREVVKEGRRAAVAVKPPRATLPEVRLDHLRLLTDDVGIIQHATFGIPDRAHGYSADDVGRALAVVCRLWEEVPRSEARRRLLPLATTYLAFLHHAQTEAGHFHNFMGYDRRFLDARGSEDTLGRVVWGLGWAVRVAPTEGIRELASRLLEAARPHLQATRPLRARAYALCGLTATRDPAWQGLVRRLADGLCDAFEATASDDWPWFEESLTYGNAKLCEALLHAHRRTGEGRYRDIALRALDHLTAVQLKRGPGGESRFDLVGNRGWCRRGGTPAVYDQQPIDAGYLVEAYVMAHQVTGEERYMELAHTAFEWFLGRNRLGEPLYDFRTGACCDGLEEGRINRNQGAESTLCFLLALLALGHRRVPDAPAAGRGRRPAAE